MALKTYKPTTPSQRELVLVDRSHLYKGKPVKGLVEGKHSTGGRNNVGRVTVRWGAAGTSVPTVWSISSGASWTCRQRSSGSSTIRTAPRLSR